MGGWKKKQGDGSGPWGGGVGEAPPVIQEDARRKRVDDTAKLESIKQDFERMLNAPRAQQIDNNNH